MVQRAKVVVASGRGVAERWRKQYQKPSKEWGRTVDGDAEVIYNKLCDLGPNPDIKAVAEAIGNQSWSYLTCDGCGEYVTRAVDLTREYADSSNIICEQCLRDGLSAITADREKNP